MSDRVATRSALIELREERSSMREGYTFLDEKCLLLAGAMLRELARYQGLWHEFVGCLQAADDALRSALGRHGLEGLANYPLASQAVAAQLQINIEHRSIMGVSLQDASSKIWPPAVADPLLRSPEADACAIAHAAALRMATELAAAGSNLERLQHEYRRTSRRARALDGVLLPELDHEVNEMSLSFEEQEREESISMRRGVR